MTADLPQPHGSGQAKLILSMGRDGSIIQFNARCEEVTGFSRPEVVHRPFTTLLSPDGITAWEELFGQVGCSLAVPQFTLSLVTKSTSKVPVLWNGFAVCDALKELQSICLLGVPMEPIDEPMPNGQQSPQIPLSETAHTEVVVNEPPQEPAEIRHEVAIEAQVDRAHDMEELHSDVAKLIREMVSVQQLIQTLLSTMNTHYTMLAKLPIDLETAAKQVQENPPAQGTLLGKPRKWSVQDPFGFKWRETQLVEMKAQLDARKIDLESREEYLFQERKLLDQRLDEFCQWKEKLKGIEAEIEHRRSELQAMQRQEQCPQAKELTPLEPEDITQILETMPESAVIVQRGIIKQSNTSFLTLVGYSGEEILEKSLFDLIAAEGLGQVEKYYLDRLKGEPLEGYSTVLATKSESLVPVAIRVKPTLFNGEKAEVLLVNSAE
jgi:PAS domain S-box-containing protein